MLDLLKETGLSGAKPSRIPIQVHHGLCADQGKLLTDMQAYRRLVGKLIYLTLTRPDISYPVYILSQFVSAPRQPHWNAAVKLLRYLKKAPGQGLFFSSASSLNLSAYCDTNWGACQTTRRSITGYCVFVGSSLIS